MGCVEGFPHLLCTVQHLVHKQSTSQTGSQGIHSQHSKVNAGKEEMKAGVDGWRTDIMDSKDGVE